MSTETLRPTLFCNCNNSSDGAAFSAYSCRYAVYSSSMRERLVCGRYVLTDPLDILKALFGFSSVPSFDTSFNIAPGSPIPAIGRENNSSSALSLSLLHWGLIPSWTQDANRSAPPINARQETVHEKPTFRDSFARQRCLIPANGFYEWKKISDTETQPFFISSKNRPLMLFAGLWDSWRAPDGNRVTSCAILTTAASGDLAEIHHRKPVTVLADDANNWLFGSDRSSLPGEDRQEELTAYPVSKKVGNIQNNDADLLEEIEFSDSPAQGSLF